MGRYASPRSRTTLDLAPRLKRRAMVWAFRHEMTLGQMVEEGLRLMMQRKGGAK